MLHRLVLPFEPDELAGIFALQVQLLELACVVSKLDQAAIRAHFSDTNIAKWIICSYQRTVGPLNTFAAQCPHEVKRQILSELKADYAFWEYRSDPKFAFRFQATDTNRQTIAMWLKGYFEQFERGIDEAVTRSHFVNKSVWLGAFKAANPSVLTCPSCDGAMKGGVTVDHFLPRGRYPVLSIHVANMVPICKDCNQLKEDEDPLEDAKLSDLFFPYHRHALDSCAVQVAPTENGSYNFVLAPKDPNADLSVALREMGRLYRVPQQWDRNERQIVDIATAKIIEQIEADRDDGIAINAEVEFRAMLEKLCQRMARQQGRQHYFVPATGWLMWAKDNFTDKLWPEFQRLPPHP